MVLFYADLNAIVWKQYLPKSYNKEREKEPMQNDWIPAGSFWQISSFYLLSSTGMLIYWWKEDKCIHTERTPDYKTRMKEKRDQFWTNV